MCLAASIYVDSSLRDQRFSAGAIRILASKLMKETQAFLMSHERDLFELGDGEDVEGKNELMLRLMWVFAFGAVASFGRQAERGWFVWQFSRSCGCLGIISWDKAERVLRETLWNGNWEMPKGALWREVSSGKMEGMEEGVNLNRTIYPS